jgi:dipeptidyl aminopeptidase/acylaminoacyl peptidase
VGGPPPGRPRGADPHAAAAGLRPDGMGPTHGVAWWTTLRDHGLPCELVLYDDEGHLFSRPENKADMVARAAAWFRRHQTNP